MRFGYIPLFCNDQLGFLIPSLFTLKQEAGTSKNQGTGYGVQLFSREVRGDEGGGSSFLAEAFFSELRVITIKTKKYSTLKTTTDYPAQQRQ